MAEIRDILGFPFKMAGAFVRIAGRITIGSVGFVLMGAGLLCVSPLQIWWAGVPLLLVGLLLLVKAIF
ncbi:MAG TPA: hypothetical protein VF950_21775 [Planctomycetota bacterium]